MDWQRERGRASDGWPANIGHILPGFHVQPCSASDWALCWGFRISFRVLVSFSSLWHWCCAWLVGSCARDALVPCSSMTCACLYHGPSYLPVYWSCPLALPLGLPCLRGLPLWVWLGLFGSLPLGFLFAVLTLPHASFVNMDYDHHCMRRNPLVFHWSFSVAYILSRSFQKIQIPSAGKQSSVGLEDRTDHSAEAYKFIRIKGRIHTLEEGADASNAKFMCPANPSYSEMPQIVPGVAGLGIFACDGWMVVSNVSAVEAETNYHQINAYITYSYIYYICIYVCIYIYYV